MPKSSAGPTSNGDTFLASDSLEGPGTIAAAAV